MSSEITIRKPQIKPRGNPEKIAGMQFGKISKERHSEISRKAGQSKSPAKIAAATMNLPYNKPDLTPERMYAITCIKTGDYNEVIKHILLTIITKADSAKEWNELLTQLLKLPFVQKIQQDMNREKQRDIIPIVVDVLRDAGQDELIGELYARLKKEGWNDRGTDAGRPIPLSPEVFALRPVQDTSHTESGTVESADNKDASDISVSDVSPENNIQ